MNYEIEEEIDFNNEMSKLTQKKPVEKTTSKCKQAHEKWKHVFDHVANIIRYKISIERGHEGESKIYREAAQFAWDGVIEYPKFREIFTNGTGAMIKKEIEKLWKNKTKKALDRADEKIEELIWNEGYEEEQQEKKEQEGNAKSELNSDKIDMDKVEEILDEMKKPVKKTTSKAKKTVEKTTSKAKKTAKKDVPVEEVINADKIVEEVCKEATKGEGMCDKETDFLISLLSNDEKVEKKPVNKVEKIADKKVFQNAVEQVKKITKEEVKEIVAEEKEDYKGMEAAYEDWANTPDEAMPRPCVKCWGDLDGMEAAYEDWKIGATEAEDEVIEEIVEVKEVVEPVAEVRSNMAESPTNKDYVMDKETESVFERLFARMGRVIRRLAA